MKVAETLKIARAKKGLTQQDLAEQANISSMTISNIENGLHYPTERTQQAIEQITGPVDWPLTFQNGSGERISRSKQ